MSQSASNQTAQEEEKNEHFFIKYIQNKIRGCNKKLKQIEQLENQNEALIINADQQKKIDGKKELQEQLVNYKQMLTSYQNAEKEFGIKRKQTQKSQKMEKFRQEEKIVTDAISFMMDLQYLSAYLSKGQQQISPELQQYQEQINQIKQLHERCFKLSGGKKQKLSEKLEQAKNIMVSVMYQEKEWKGITQNVKMLIKKEQVCNSMVGAKDKKPSRKVSSAVQRKMSNKQSETKYEEKKETEKKMEEVQQQATAEPAKEIEKQQQEEKPAEKKYVLTKVEPQPQQEKQISRSRSNTNKDKDNKPKETKKQARKVTFDETTINTEKKDDFIEVKTRSQKKQENNKKKRFENKQGQQHYQQQRYPKKKEIGQQQKPFAKKNQQQIVQYVKKENPDEEKKQE